LISELGEDGAPSPFFKPFPGSLRKTVYFQQPARIGSKVLFAIIHTLRNTQCGGCPPIMHRSMSCWQQQVFEASQNIIDVF